MAHLESLPPEITSAIRTALHRVLKTYALNGNLGPHMVRKLFLQTADELVSAGKIERPTRLSQSFASQATRREGDNYPDYGIAASLADQMRQAIWELYGEGILMPARTMHPQQEYAGNENPWFDLDHALITQYGVCVLTDPENRIQVHDPDGYLAIFRGANPPADAEMMRYLEECVAVFRGRHLLAAVVLLGIASERLIDVLAENLTAALGEPSGTEWYKRNYSKKRDISARFESLSGKLMDEYGPELNQQKLKDGFQRDVTLVFDVIRLARNDIAHTAGRLFTWNEVSGLLFHFVQYFGYVNRIIAFLDANPRVVSS